jgi:hypothetical protein
VIGFSCDLINPPEIVPAYLRIDTSLFTSGQVTGSSSSKITDVWVEVNDAQQGVYELPKTFPVLDTGVTRLMLNAGIEDNGSSGTRVVYPFYSPDTLTVRLKEKEILPLTPHYYYKPETHFSFIEDFEAGNIFVPDKKDSFVRTNDPANVFEGSYSGEMFVDSFHPLCNVISAGAYLFPKTSPVYVELNYKAEIIFAVGLTVNQGGLATTVFQWIINPKSSWNKIYLNLGGTISQLNGDSYQISIRAAYDHSLGKDQHVYLDNVKLVSY